MAKNKLKKCIGIILNNRGIVAIEMEVKKGKPEVINYSKVIFEEDIVESNSIVIDPDRFKEAVKEVLQNGIKGPIKASQAYVVLPEQTTFEHHITIPQDKINDIAYIKEIAADFIPIELEDAVFDFVKMAEDKEKKEITIRFIATQNNIVKPLINTFKEINLEVLGIKIDVDCMIKSFANSMNKNEGNIFILNMDTERDLLSIVLKDKREYRMIQRRNQKEFTESIKSALKLNTEQDCRNVCLELKKGGKLDDRQIERIKNEISHYLNSLEDHIRNLLKIVQSDRAIQIKKVYLTGLLSGLPGIHEIVEKLFPGTVIKGQIEFTEIPAEVERELLEGLGICVSEMEEPGSAKINLLPEVRKEELSIAPLIPKFKRYFFAISIILGILIIRMGIMTTSAYINYRIKAQEAIILNEHALNPYLVSIAKLTQERKRLHDQILSVLDNSIPISIIMQSIDEKNKEGVSYQNITYMSDSVTNESRMELRAEINGRQETEAFIDSLQKERLYADIVSPLSNLLGKEERQVRVTLSINEKEVIDTFEKLKENLTETIDPNTDNE